MNSFAEPTSAETTDDKRLTLSQAKETFALLRYHFEEVNFRLMIRKLIELSSRSRLKVSLSRFYETIAPIVQQPTKESDGGTPRKPQPSTMQTTLYDQLHGGDGQSPTLADNFLKKKNCPPARHASLHQSEIHVTQNAVQWWLWIFNNAIERIDMLDNLDQAIGFLQNDYPGGAAKAKVLICRKFFMMVQSRGLLTLWRID